MIFNIKITEYSLSPSAKGSMGASLSPPARDLLVLEKTLAACVTQQFIQNLLEESREEGLSCHMAANSCLGS